MDVLFQNKYTRTEDWIKECNRYALFRTPLMMVVHVLSALMIGNGLYELFFLRVIGVPAFASPILFYTVILLLYFRMNALSKKRNKEMYGDRFEVVTEVTEDGITQTLSNGAQYVIPYTSIKRCAQTAHYLLLISDAKIIYALRKGGFTIGSDEEFFVFLSSKGVKIR